MEYYAAIDVSLELSSVCVVDGTGKIVREAKVASEPEALVTFFRDLNLVLTRVGLEAGPLSQWLHAGLTEAGLPAILIETRHVKAALKAMTVKTDRNDARGMAQLMQMGWFRPVHVKTPPAQEIRALLTGRKMLQTKLKDVELAIRGLLRGFGLKVGKVSAGKYEARICELVLGHPMLEPIAAAMPQARGGLRAEFSKLHRMLLQIVRADADCRRFMTAPGVGAVVAMTYKTAIDDPGRFRKSKDVGPYFGLTPKKYQSGETDVTGRISKIGDASVRTALYEAANVILTRPLKGSSLKTWAIRGLPTPHPSAASLCRSGLGSVEIFSTSTILWRYIASASCLPRHFGSASATIWAASAPGSKPNKHLMLPRRPFLASNSGTSWFEFAVTAGPCISAILLPLQSPAISP